jgi:hypothetical protein
MDPKFTLPIEVSGVWLVLEPSAAEGPAFSPPDFRNELLRHHTSAGWQQMRICPSAPRLHLTETRSDSRPAA